MQSKLLIKKFNFMSSHKTENKIENIRIWLPETTCQSEIIWYEKLGVICTQAFTKKNNKGVCIFYEQEYQCGRSDWEVNLLGGSS